MSYSCCSGNLSSFSLAEHLRYSGSSCGSFYPSNLIYSTDLCSPRSCQLGSSLYSQENCYEPTRCQMYCVVSIPCQTFCYHPRTSMPCSPCWSTHIGSLGYGSRRGYCLGYGSRSCYSLGCGSRGFRLLGYRVWGFSSLSHGSRFCHPMYLASRSCQMSCYQLTCIFGFYYATY
ncbi:keratin-associated protein 13-1-like [Hippopotamus amphibius kiboko]|uniref:keratin-associated protein 13-1-like n=1 Tax=Hippopotamus amphibius kiboko TaxID=575201 RepID=UPI00259A1B33|nr:keratin-associated protein 13-1-like [Hippopotamus amphibius kiboko]